MAPDGARECNTRIRAPATNRPVARPRTSAHAALLAAAALAVFAAAAAPSEAAAQATCSVSTAGGLAFGAYDPTSAVPLDSTSQIRYRCQGGGGVRISLDPGQSGTFAARELRSGAEVLLYNLYLDAARTQVWGDGTGGTGTGPGVRIHGGGGAFITTVFGRVFAGQDPAVGMYADTIRVTFDL